MNQTKKRLSIINLAISITDIETIQLQVLKLRLLKTDENIQEILSMLQNENYAQAQALITTYIDTPRKEVLQRTFQKEKEKRQAKESAVIDEFDLFKTEGESHKNTEIRTLDLDDMLRLESEGEEAHFMAVKEAPKEESRLLDLDDMLRFEEEVKENRPRAVHEEIDFDSILNVKNEDILPDNIDIDISHSANNDFWYQEESHTAQSKSVPRDTFFDEVENDETPETVEKKSPIIEYPFPEHQNDTEEEKKEETELQTLQETKPDTIIYKSIPYIDQKFKNMQVQYPVLETSDEHFTSIDTWLLKISNDGYTEQEIEEMIQTIDALRSDNSAEAAQLLLISAATESKYAQFRLARTLYKGDILQKNLPEAFTIINRLATYDDYPEAICDLAQFYEYGVGIEKDKVKAEELYKEAKDAGIKRATEHFERLKKGNKSFFTFLTK